MLRTAQSGQEACNSIAPQGAIVAKLGLSDTQTQGELAGREILNVPASAMMSVEPIEAALLDGKTVLISALRCTREVKDELGRVTTRASATLMIEVEVRGVYAPFIVTITDARTLETLARLAKYVPEEPTGAVLPVRWTMRGRQSTFAPVAL